MSVKLKTIEQKAGEFKPTFTRMDIDMDLGFLKEFEFIGFDKRPVPKIINLTLNDPAVFAMKCIAILQSALPELHAESETMSQDSLSLIERFSEDLYITADEGISLSGLFGLHPFVVEQSCYRGRMGVFSLIRMVDGKPLIDFRPVDMRYVIYEQGMRGFNWVCYITNHSRAYLMEKYGKDIGDKLSEICWDVYDREDNDFYVGNTGFDTVEPLLSQKHGFKDENGDGYVPFVMEKVPTGSMLAHPDAMMHDGESIFALNRGLYPEMNRLATTLHNLTLASFFGAKQYASEAGEKKKTKALPFGLGVVVSIEKGGGYTLIPVNDIRNATRLEYSMLESRIQRGSLPNIDYGNLTFPLSSVAIGKLTEAKDQIFIPRLSSTASLKKKLTKMGIMQLNAITDSVELGEEGRKKTYKLGDLKGDYALRYKYFAESKEQRLANITEAQSLRGLIPDQALREETLKRRDPQKDLEQLRDEKAEATDVAIMYFRRTETLIKYENYIEAEMSLRSLELILRQRQMQQQLALNPPVSGGEQPPSPMPLLGTDRGGGQPARSGKSEEQREEQEVKIEEALERRAEKGEEGRPAPAFTGGR